MPNATTLKDLTLAGLEKRISAIESGEKKAVNDHIKDIVPKGNFLFVARSEDGSVFLKRGGTILSFGENVKSQIDSIILCCKTTEGR